jgi:hypothetical protein
LTRRLSLLACIAAIAIAGGVLTGVLSLGDVRGGADASPDAIGLNGGTPPDTPSDLDGAAQSSIEESPSSEMTGGDLDLERSLDPKGEALPAGVLEDSVVLNGQALSMEAAVAALGSDRFDQFVLGLERGARSPAVAADLTSAYRQGIEASLRSLEGAQLDHVGCGENVCAFQVTTPADQPAFAGWLDQAFSSAGLPGHSFITAPLPGSGGAPDRYRVLVTINPAAGAISSRISP